MLVSSKVVRLRLVAAFILAASILASALGVTSGLRATGVQAAAPIVKVAAGPQPNSPAANTSLVISQVYGGGGNSGATYKNDFIEIFNRSASAVTITNWSVQYASSAGTSWAVSVLTGTVTLQPGQYYLIQEAAGTGGTVSLPTPDSIGSISMSATAGKVALVNNSTALTGCGANNTTNTCVGNASVVDYVGFGTAADYEGTAAAPAPSATTADIRNGGGCTDTDNNNTDFTAGAPTPRNSTTAFNVCAVVNTSTPTETLTPGGATATDTTAATATQTGTPTITPTATQTAVAGLRIRDIQGAAHISPYNGQRVSSVGGVVTFKKSNGFYMQDPSPDTNDATSEAILVFTGSAPNVTVGDSIVVTGTVTEFRPGGSSGSDNLTTTEIAGSPTFSILSGGNPLPAAVIIGSGGRIPPSTIIEDDATGSVETSGTFDPASDGIDFYESMESMRVQVNNAVAVGPTRAFGTTNVNRELPVVGDNGANASVRTTRGGVVIQPTDFNPERIILNDTLAGGSGVTVPTANVGDTLPGATVGIMDYTFGNFKLQVTSIPALVSGGLAREQTTAAGPNQLAIGNFNVENLAPTDPQSKFDTLAGLIVNNLRSPDLLSIEEIQDNSGATDNGVVAADQTWNKLIAAIQATNGGTGPTYTYRQIDPVNDQDGGQPGGNIRQGFLFRTDRGLAFIDRPGATSTTAAAVVSDPNGPQLNYSPVRIDPTNAAWNSSRKPLVGEFTYNGQKFFVIGNHFNSKGGDEPIFGKDQPPARSSETQRHQQALIVNNFVNQILSQDANANIVVAGDLNDFQFSETLSDLESGAPTGGTKVLNNLIDTLPLAEQYTYDYEGNSQAIDHTLVSNHVLNSYSPIDDVVHVNSEFAVQSSDHDPQVALLNVPAPATATTTATQTGTSTGTATETGTATNTATQTASSTATTTQTSTSTATTIPSNTATNTASQTASSTATNTATRSSTPSNTATNTATTTATQTGTSTGTATNTRTAVPSSTTTSTAVPSSTTTSTAVPSGTSTPTRTAVPSASSTTTATASATPTVCRIQFQDVPPSSDVSSFYPFVQCLACRGVLGGYPCGGTNNQTGQPEPCGGTGNPYFRPSNNITRAQIAKIVSNAAGFNNAVTGQTYADVPPSNDVSSFYQYIQRLTARNVMSGYPCDPTPGSAEPCDGQNRAYFRPGNSATRGQLAKIVSNAAGFVENVSGQTFADVPPSTEPSSFYLYVERLARRNVIGGYPCGTTDQNSGPCDAQNRPYFRPGNLVSRAQAAKIVANTFFPNCQTRPSP